MSAGVWMVALGVVAMASAARADDYKPAKCATALPYEGPALYSGRVPLPSRELPLGTAEFDSATIRRLDQAMLEAMRLTGARVMSAAVANPDGFWSATRAADGSLTTKRPYWASAGKALTAAVVLLLVEEGKLSLDDPVSRWAPNLPNASSITIDHLLQHTAGLFSANEDLVVRRKPRYRSPDEDIRISARHGAMFCPGQRWRYSNTGYTVLGKIIEQIDGRPYHESVNARVCQPLGLTTLRALAPLEEPADVAPLAPAKGARPMVSSSWPFAAGSVVGSASDMVRFWHAFITSRLLSPTTTARLFEHLYPMFDPATFYGRGVMLYVLPYGEERKGIWLGHSGGTPGAKAVVAFSPPDDAFVAVALTGDGSAEASANLLLRRLNAEE